MVGYNAFLIQSCTGFVIAKVKELLGQLQKVGL